MDNPTSAAAVSGAVAAAAAGPPSTVAAIFARAERVFERRVDQLLHVKRAKARAAGTPFNARKAKRDARTVAGREKLDALVRRLADLAAVQENALGHIRAREEAAKLDAAAAAILGFAALAELAKDTLPQHPTYVDPHILPHYLNDASYVNPQEMREYVPVELPEFVPRSPPPYVVRDLPVQLSPMSPEYAAPAVEPVETVVCEDPDASRDALDTSSCSDDASLTGGLASFKDALEPDVCDVASDPRRVHQQQYHHSKKGADRDRHIFPATESVVNFVLECDEESHNSVVQQHGGTLYGGDMRHAAATYPGFEGYDNRFPTRPIYERYDCRRAPPPCTRPNWPLLGYPMQSASSL